MRKLLIAAAAALSLCPLHAKTRLAVISDIHVMAPELVEKEGSAFSAYIAGDRKMLKESIMLLSESVRKIIAEKPDAVLVTGDLTKDGELVSHLLVSDSLFMPFRNSGIPVYVIPGNHDVNNPHSRIFRGDSTVRTTTVSSEEFASIYSPYGYGQASERDPYSLSYAADLGDSIRLLAIDACRHEENDFDENICVTGGRIKPQTMEFIKEQAEKAEKDGRLLIAMMHHGIVRHWKWQDRAMSEYLVEDWKKCARRFGRYGVNIVFTGHFHAQDIVSAGSGKRKVYDIETGSTVSCPLSYRIVDIDAEKGRMDISTRYICDGLENGRQLEEQAVGFAKAGIRSIVDGMVPSSIPGDIRSEAAELVAEAYVAHIRGDESMSEDYVRRLDSVSRKLRPHSFKYAYILEHIAAYMHTDIVPADNDITLMTGK